MPIWHPLRAFVYVSLAEKLVLCDNGTGFSLDGILYMSQRGDQYTSLRIGIQIGDSCFNLGKHGACLELTFCDISLCLLLVHGGDGSSIFFAVVFVYTIHIGENDQLVSL